MLTNVQIEEEMIGKDRNIEIKPFYSDRLSLYCYRLIPRWIKVTTYDEESVNIDTDKVIDLKDNPYPLQSHQHVKIIIEEKIVLSERFFGRFYPASICIENGLILTCGHLDPSWEKPIRFGLFNATKDVYTLRYDEKKGDIARIEFEKINEKAPIRSVDKTNDYLEKIFKITKSMEEAIKELDAEKEKKIKESHREIEKIRSAMKQE